MKFDYVGIENVTLRCLLQCPLSAIDWVVEHGFSMSHRCDATTFNVNRHVYVLTITRRGYHFWADMKFSSFSPWARLISLQWSSPQSHVFWFLVHYFYSLFITYLTCLLYGPFTRILQDMSPLNEVCTLPFAMYCTHVMSNDDGSVESYYERSNALWMNRSHCTAWPSKLTSLRVIRSQPLQIPKSTLGLSLGPNLIRQCCVRSTMALEGNDTVGTIWLGSCEKRI